MKKEKLKQNESCKILLGTYPMANEGLDIPSLNGLVLSTPKSDIIQSVGRICRMKHDNIQPLIIDMVDIFSIFEIQSRKRFSVYKKKKYEIEDIRYNLDKDVVLMRKTYNFHNLPINNSDDSSEDSEYICDIDTEYKNIDTKTNKKITKKSNKIFDKKTPTEKDKIENLFKSFSMFS